MKVTALNDGIEDLVNDYINDRGIFSKGMKKPNGGNRPYWIWHQAMVYYSCRKESHRNTYYKEVLPAISKIP